jgi:hypothetical protein
MPGDRLVSGSSCVVSPKVSRRLQNRDRSTDRTSGDDGHTITPEIVDELGKRARVAV